MEKFSADIIVIGAGAAGMMAASGAAQTISSRLASQTAGEEKQEGSGRVIVLEKMPRPGRKIMITGKGRCNFTNVKPWSEFSGHIHPKANFLKPSFFNLPPEKMTEYLQANGMESVVERGDRAFPVSQSAAEVVDSLLRAAKKAGAEICCGKEVCAIEHTEDGKFGIRCSDGSVYDCRKLIICTGGLSYQATGSTGDGYGWARQCGHSVSQLFPSLTAIVPKGYKRESSEQKEYDGSPWYEGTRGHIGRSTPLSEAGSALCGNQLKNVSVTLIIDGNPAQTEFGDIDFTDGGIEGPVGFKISRRCVKGIINGSKAGISIDIKPAVSPEALSGRLMSLWEDISKDRRSAGKPYKDRFRVLLGKVLPQQLIPAFVKCNPGLDHKTLAKTLKNWKFDIGGFVGYERCVITAGGVLPEEFTAKTLESKLVPGLYFAGEILDLDADTGGYNLQMAFSTGYLAGISAAKAL